MDLQMCEPYSIANPEHKVELQLVKVERLFERAGVRLDKEGAGIGDRHPPTLWDNVLEYKLFGNRNAFFAQGLGGFAGHLDGGLICRDRWDERRLLVPENAPLILLQY